MKPLFAILFLFAMVTYSQAQLSEIPQKNIPKDYGYIVKLGEQIPNIQFRLTDGRWVNISDLKGKVVMLQFTASWCPVCRREMPHIENEIWQQHKNNPDFALYGIDMDEPLEKVINFSQSMKITYPLALDPGAKIFYTIADKGAGVTRNIIIDKNGKIVYLTRLYKEEEFNEMKEVINLLLKS